MFQIVRCRMNWSIRSIKYNGNLAILLVMITLLEDLRISKNTKIYIWSREFGQLHKILEGSISEVILDVAWHPTRSMIVSCTSGGSVYVWSRQHTESWSAFAPGFTELEENEEYIEQEDEFDIIDEEEIRKKKAEEELEEEEYVDMTTRTDKDAEEDEFILPTHPIPDTYFVPQTLVAPPSKKQGAKKRGFAKGGRKNQPEK